MSLDHEAFLRHVPARPGVYRMLDEAATVLYVGKARDLKKRLASYFRRRGQSPKTLAMIDQVASIETTITRSEGEALLLENNLIKALRPRYNVLLRDDKSYPYIYLATDHEFPRLAFHRGARNGPGRYFGPYPGAGAVRETLALIQKVFRVRQCEDVFYRNRSRPCLQYQIQRCSGPCVGLVDAASYAEDVQQAVLFLEGRSDALIAELVERMERASAGREYERAAVYRDRVATVRRVQERQYVDTGAGDVDVLGIAREAGQCCVAVLFVRGGRHIGARTYFPRGGLDEEGRDVVDAFVARHYLDRTVPREILVPERSGDAAVLSEVLTAQAGYRVKVRRPERGPARQWIEMANRNAAEALRQELAGRASMAARLDGLVEALGLAAVPERIECFDVSHTGGEAAVASCVVFDRSGSVRADYRCYNIRNVTPGDDYAALAEALTRRYRKVKEGDGVMPDLLLIDGGKGQVNAAHAVLDELQVAGLTLAGVAKGEGRKPGLERLFIAGELRPLVLPADSPALHLVQQIRDEAHRFAITAHRRRRGNTRTASRLELIPGVGARRRQQLLRHLGGMQEVMRANVEQLSRVPGISMALANRIYDSLHGD